MIHRVASTSQQPERGTCACEPVLPVACGSIVAVLVLSLRAERPDCSSVSSSRLLSGEAGHRGRGHKHLVRPFARTQLSSRHPQQLHIPRRFAALPFCLPHRVVVCVVTGMVNSQLIVGRLQLKF